MSSLLACQILTNVSLVLMTVMIREWRTVLTYLEVLAVHVKPAIQEVEEMGHVEVVNLMWYYA